MNTSKHQETTFDVLNKSRNRSTEIYLEERYGPKNSYGGVFQYDILDDEEISKTKDKFIRRPGEKVLVVVNDIKWVENGSTGPLTLTNQRLFYTPEYYDIAQTTKNLEINLESINSIGHWRTGAVSAIILYVGGRNIKIEFTSPIPLKLFKMWRALKPLNKKWKILRG